MNVHAGVRRHLAVLASLAVLPFAAAPAVAGPRTTPEDAPGAVAADDWVVPAAPARLVVDTEGAAPVVSKDDYVAGTMELEGVTHSLRIKGRGNSTWQWPKKPYKLKLDDDASLLGLPADDEWVLLANYADRAALRNHLALNLAGRVRTTWTPRTRFVEVVLNGTSQGLYLLTEQVEEGEARVVLPDDGHLLEIDERYRASGDPGFRSSLRSTPVVFKDPDEVTVAQRRRVKGAVRRFEEALYGKDFAHPRKGYAAHVDVDSVVDWYLVEELFRNQDSNFFSSVYVTWSPGAGFAMGPVWDFDLSAGSKWNAETAPQGWHTRRGRHWVARMFEDPAFARKVKARWAQLRPTVVDMVRQLPAAADVLRPAALADWPLWHVGDGRVPGTVHADSFDGEVEFLRDWLTDRVEWMSRDEVVVDRASWRVRERDRVVWVPVRVLGEHDVPLQVRYAWRGGSATPGEDFTLEEGVLRFAPGENLRSIPVRLHADDVPERAEKIHLALASPDGRPRLGHPSRVTLTIEESDQRIDAVIGARGARTVGKGVLGGPARRQTLHVAARRGSQRVLKARVVNLGNARNEVVLRASRSRPGTSVRHVVRGEDVTRAMRSGRGLRVRVGPGRKVLVRTVVRVRPGAEVGSRKAVRVKAVWRGDRRQVDTVRGMVRVTR